MLKDADYSPWKGELAVRHLSGACTAEAFIGFFRQGWYSLILVLSGEIQIEPEGSALLVKLSSGRLCWLSDGASVSAVAVPLRCYLLSCTRELAVQSRVARYGIGHLEEATAQAVSVIPLSSAEIRQLVQLMEMLRRKIDGSRRQPLQDAIVMLCLNLLLCEYGALYHKKSENQTAFHSRDEKITIGFLALADANAGRRRDVNFYADALCITHRHLRKAVRRATGRPVKYFIEAGLVAEALLLLSDEELSVTEISERLDFGSLSSFSAFFKKHAELSPNQYRKRLRP